MEETVICRICLEPIFNFLCIDCLGSSVGKWISSVKPKMKREFRKFHKSIINHISTDENQENCIKCKNTTDAVICPYCYEKEVFWWIFSKNPKLSQIFSKLFNFDFLGTGYLPAAKIRNLEPVILVDKRNRSDMNFCENCGQASDDLREENGVWACESCRE